MRPADDDSITLVSCPVCHGAGMLDPSTFAIRRRRMRAFYIGEILVAVLCVALFATACIAIAEHFR